MGSPALRSAGWFGRPPPPPHNHPEPDGRKLSRAHRVSLQRAAPSGEPSSSPRSITPRPLGVCGVCRMGGDRWRMVVVVVVGAQCSSTGEYG